jgi:hypothetical protein
MVESREPSFCSLGQFCWAGRTEEGGCWCHGFVIETPGSGFGCLERAGRGYIQLGRYLVGRGQLLSLVVTFPGVADAHHTKGIVMSVQMFELDVDELLNL